MDTKQVSGRAAGDFLCFLCGPAQILWGEMVRVGVGHNDEVRVVRFLFKLKRVHIDHRPVLRLKAHGAVAHQGYVP